MYYKVENLRDVNGITFGTKVSNASINGMNLNL